MRCMWVHAATRRRRQRLGSHRTRRAGLAAVVGAPTPPPPARKQRREQRTDSPCGREGADRRSGTPTRRRRLPRRRAWPRTRQMGHSSEPAPYPTASRARPRSRRAPPRPCITASPPREAQPTQHRAGGTRRMVGRRGWGSACRVRAAGLEHRSPRARTSRHARAAPSHQRLRMRKRSHW